MFTVRHQQTQTGRGGFETMSLGAKKYCQSTARLGGELQTPQPAIVGALQPQQHRGADTGTQGLFGGPQCFRGAGRPHHQQAPQLDSLLRQGRSIRLIGRCNPNEPRALVAYTTTSLTRNQGRQEKLHVAHTRLVQQHFNERRRRPPTPGQTRIQRAATGGPNRTGGGSRGVC